MPATLPRNRAALSSIVVGLVLAAGGVSCGHVGEAATEDTTAVAADTSAPLLGAAGLPGPELMDLRGAMLGSYTSAATTDAQESGGEGETQDPAEGDAEQEGETPAEGPRERDAQETDAQETDAQDTDAQDTEAEDTEAPESRDGRSGRGKRPEKTEEDRRGIPVTDELVRARCSQCHETDEDGLMGRISYMRKSPEGWELSLKRMIRLNSVVVTPEEARHIVRYLANDHGLARAEAERAHYGVERRVHWSEEEYDKELRESCAECHTLGRVLGQRRDAKEWKLLKATHLAFFPLADFQAFRGRRRGGEQIDWESLSPNEASERWEEMQNRRGPDQADRVLGELTKSQGLFTPEWEAWQVNRREVPLAGTWTVVGHETSRGDVRGEVEISRVDEDTYDTRWSLAYEDGRKVTRSGKGLLYAGYSWRGRSTTTAPREPETLREVLLLNEDWDHMRGRIFTGEYHELGMDVTLYRQGAATEIFAVDDPALMIPSQERWISVFGAGFPEDVQATDFHLGRGVEVTAVQRLDAENVRLRLDVARDAEQGKRFLSYRARRGALEVVLYDTIDYIEVTPGEGLARIGGTFRPRQLERFEAVAMNRGQDGEPYTDDDFAVRVVPARWSLEEFPAREGDDDVQFVGEIDAETGVFTPGADGPNPARRWEANNIGDVYVVATTKLTVRKIEPPPKKKKKKPEESAEQEGAEAEGEAPTEAPEVEPAEEPTEKPIVMEEREFRARGHLLVMVPIYVNWDKYEWDRR